NTSLSYGTTFSSTTMPIQTPFVLRADAALDFMWIDLIDAFGATPIAASANLSGEVVVGGAWDTQFDGGGVSLSSPDGGPFLIAYDLQGNRLWTQASANPDSSGASEKLRDVRVADDGSAYAAFALSTSTAIEA